MLLAVAAATWIELWLWRAASQDQPGWLRVVLGLCAWLFVPALVLGVVLAIRLRRR